MTAQTIILSPPSDLIGRIEQARAVSIADPGLARRLPLARLVEATITAACPSPHTARYYRRAMGEFIKLLGTERADILGGLTLTTRRLKGKRKAAVWDYGETPAGVLLLVDAPLVDKYRRNSRKSHYHAVRTFLSVALRDNVLTSEQARALGIKAYQPKVSRKSAPVGRRLTPLEVQLVLSVIPDSLAGHRDRAMLAVMLYLGLRREEAAKLGLSDFKRDKGRWAVSFTGKGDKDRKLNIPAKLFDILATWLDAYERDLGDDAPAFVGIRKGGHIGTTAITPRAVSEIVARYGALGGIAAADGEGRLTAHDLRRTFARRAYDLGAGLPAIQIALGHADPKTTAHYIGLGQDAGASVTDLVRYD